MPEQEAQNEEEENEIQNAFENMIFKIKEKLQNPTSTRVEKIQVLTLAPETWSRKKVSNVFEVSERLVRDAKQQEIQNGIFSLPPPRKGKTLSSETVEKVTKFYENNKNSRIMPGIKDRVSVRKHVYQQKRLLLCTLKELYSLFKEQNPLIKIGFSKFCELRPKWCVSAGHLEHIQCVSVLSTKMLFS